MYMYTYSPKNSQKIRPKNSLKISLKINGTSFNQGTQKYMYMHISSLTHPQDPQTFQCIHVCTYVQCNMEVWGLDMGTRLSILCTSVHKGEA